MLPRTGKQRDCLSHHGLTLMLDSKTAALAANWQPRLPIFTVRNRMGMFLKGGSEGKQVRFPFFL